MALDRVELVRFDMAGTTVDDRQTGPSLVVTAFVDAFAKVGFEVAAEQANRHRSKEKRKAIRSLLRELGQADDWPPDKLVDAVHSISVGKLHRGIESLKETQGTRQVLRFLTGRGVRVGVGSGFPQEVVKAIVDKFGWEPDGLVDYVGCAEQVGASRPDPKMILLALAKFDIADPKSVVKVGDRAVDIVEGKNAGARTVGVLSGSQREDELRAAGADYVLQSVALVPQLFEE